ncbi:hypothetical protein PIB30_039458 [Stylosanthes scabra]|uniref:Uncharacterized protein n=1 Tax=Stylosanthes scabra TaxID=79078 RepID=A0ABU6VDB0_9FABA|nr:hypothetical protein [Stylosanthes scabra]
MVSSTDPSDLPIVVFESLAMSGSLVPLDVAILVIQLVSKGNNPDLKVSRSCVSPLSPSLALALVGEHLRPGQKSSSHHDYQRQLRKLSASRLLFTSSLSFSMNDTLCHPSFPNPAPWSPP